MKRDRAIRTAASLLLAIAFLALWRSAVTASQSNGPDAPVGPGAVPEPFPEYNRQPVTRSSNLPLEGGARVSDRELARYITTYLGITNCHSMKFVFGQCFGGGMIDELADAGITCTVSAQSAAQHDESSYGNGSEDYYLKALGEILEMSPTLSLEEAAKLARERDPRGPYAPSVANRKEHPQYHGSGPLSSTVAMTGADSFHAILLAGNPDGARHWGDLKRWYHLLTSTYGFTAGEISVLYGDGTWPTGDDAIEAPFPDDPGIPIISATLRNLTRTLKRIGGLMNPNEQFFFWSSDHGGNGAVPTGGNGYGNGACTWGESDDSCEIEMAVALSDAELARITDGSALAFTYVVTSELGPPRFEVWFNASRLELPPPEPGTQRVRLPLAPGVFVQENVITFRASSADAARRVALSAGLGGARVGDARLWFGPRTTQVSLEYSVFLPFVLRDYP